MATERELRIDTRLITTDIRRQFKVLLEAFEQMRDANSKLTESCRGAIDALDQIEQERMQRESPGGSVVREESTSDG